MQWYEVTFKLDPTCSNELCRCYCRAIDEQRTMVVSIGRQWPVVMRRALVHALALKWVPVSDEKLVSALDKYVTKGPSDFEKHMKMIGIGK